MKIPAEHIKKFGCCLPIAGNLMGNLKQDEDIFRAGFVKIIWIYCAEFLETG